MISKRSGECNKRHLRQRTDHDEQRCLKEMPAPLWRLGRCSLLQPAVSTIILCPI
jgi:hypothetical protein